MVKSAKPFEDDYSEESAAIYLRLLIELFSDNVDGFLSTESPPEHIMAFIQQADRRELRDLFMETAKRLHQTRKRSSPC